MHADSQNSVPGQIILDGAGTAVQTDRGAGGHDQRRRRIGLFHQRAQLAAVESEARAAVICAFPFFSPRARESPGKGISMDTDWSGEFWLAFMKVNGPNPGRLIVSPLLLALRGGGEVEGFRGV